MSGSGFSSLTNTILKNNKKLRQRNSKRLFGKKSTLLPKKYINIDDQDYSISIGRRNKKEIISYTVILFLTVVIIVVCMYTNILDQIMER